MLFSSIWVSTFFVLASSALRLLPDGYIPNPLDAVIFRNKCLEGLGCFYNGPPFYHPILRPISLPPFDLEDMKTKFVLFTRDNREEAYTLLPTDESLDNSTFDENVSTKFIIHGFLSELNEDDQRHHMKNALLEHDRYNIIIVDWTKSNGNPYPQAVSNARVVGAQVAQMIQFLQDRRNISSKSVHVIGHSLGSHIAGWTGKRIHGLGRITALDPAGPYFIRSGKKIRLDVSDANFVDVIHTNIGDVAILDGFGLGLPDPVGHSDFYPNGGEHQPGCSVTIINSTIAGMNFTIVGDRTGLTYLMAMSCDHSRGYDYFTSSINKNCKFESVQCEEYDDFKKDECKTNQTAFMGFHAKKNPHFIGKKLFLKTTADRPYCLEYAAA